MQPSKSLVLLVVALLAIAAWLAFASLGGDVAPAAVPATPPPSPPHTMERAAVAAAERTPAAPTPAPADVAAERHGLVITCRQMGTDVMLPGMAASVFDPTTSRLLVRDAITDATGSVVVPDLAAGRYLVMARDPRRQWAVAASSAGPSSEVTVPGEPITLEFAEGHVAEVEFVNDVLLSVRTGKRTAGMKFAPDVGRDDQSSPVPGTRVGGRRGAIPTRYRYVLRFTSSKVSANPTLQLTAYGRVRGECTFEVPLSPATRGSEVVYCDMAEFPVRPATPVTVQVIDRDGQTVDPGPISLRSRKPMMSLDIPANVESFVPPGFVYEVTVGDFPIEWKSKAQARLDLTQAPGRAVNLVVRLEDTMVRTNLSFTVDGSPFDNPPFVWCSVRGRFGRADDISGSGSRLLLYGGRLDACYFPVGHIPMVVSDMTRRWGVDVPITSDTTECAIDLKASEAERLAR